MENCRFLSLTVSLCGVFCLFSSSGAKADFNGDSYGDLAIGVPYENVGSVTDAGSVSVIYGTAESLSGTGDEYWIQNYLDGSGSETFEYFGMAMAVGDLNGDGLYDLAIGVSHEDVGAVAQAGAVNVIYGSRAGGFDAVGNQYWNQDITNMAGVSETDDHFGASLAVGDFNNDGYDDLAIGVPDEDVDVIVDAGVVQVMYGAAGGLSADADEILDQGGGAETGDRFGASLAAGDFNRDGYVDLAVGIPNEDLVAIGNTGAVEIYYGSSGGLLSRVSNDFWHQDRSGVADTADENDYFGLSLTAADFNGDGYTDLAVGVPYEDVGSPAVANAGAVNVLYGSSSGITGTGSDYWHQESTGIGSLAEVDDRFGFSLTAADFNGDGYGDLVVGVPYEHWNDPDTGIVHILSGTPDGLTGTGSQLWRQGLTGIEETEEADDRFGYALAAGDFDGNGSVDLAIGVPYESVGAVEQAGIVHVLYSTTEGLSATGSQVWYQGYSGLQGSAETGDRFGYSLAAIPPKKTGGLFFPIRATNGNTVIIHLGQ